MNRDKAIQLLTILFYVLALATVVVYLINPSNIRPMLYVGGSAIIVRLVTYLLRYLM